MVQRENWAMVMDQGSVLLTRSDLFGGEQVDENVSV